MIVSSEPYSHDGKPLGIIEHHRDKLDFSNPYHALCGPDWFVVVLRDGTRKEAGNRRSSAEKILRKAGGME